MENFLFRQQLGLITTQSGLILNRSLIVFRINLRPKLQLFARKLVCHILLITDNLRCFGMDIDAECPFYDKDVETTNHIFLSCDLTLNFWFIIDTCRPTPIDTDISVKKWMEYI